MTYQGIARAQHGEPHCGVHEAEDQPDGDEDGKRDGRQLARRGREPRLEAGACRGVSARAHALHAIEQLAKQTSIHRDLGF